MQVDMPLAELQKYRPALTRQPDFDKFWQTALHELRQEKWDVQLEPITYPVPQIQAYKLKLTGFNGSKDGSTLTGWYILPQTQILARADRLPLLIHQNGYGDYRQQIGTWLTWVLQGIAILAVDVRNQGESSDGANYAGKRVNGFMTQGLLDLHQYYYRNVFLDALRVVDFAMSRPEIDPERVIFKGESQGGGITLAVAALDNRLKAVMPGVPYLCHWQRALETFQSGPYQELVEFFQRYPQDTEQAYNNLSYFDGMNFADKIKCPLLISIGLIDDVCPPSTGFAVINHLKCEHQVCVYPWSKHSAGWTPPHLEAQIEFVRKYFV